MQHAVFYAGDAVAHHAVVVEHAAVPILRIVRHGHVRPLPTAGDATAKAQLGQGPIERSGIVCGDEEIFLVHGLGLERPGAVPLKPELLLHHKSVLHKVVRDNTADLFAGLALFSIGGVNQIPADAAMLTVGGDAVNAPGSCSWRRAVCSMFSPPLLALRCTQMQGRLEQASRSQLGAVAKVQVFVSFDRRHYTSNYSAFAQITQNVLPVGTSPYSPTKTCTFLCNKKKPLNQRLFLFWQEKGDRPVWTVAFVNCCEVRLRRES